MSVPRPPTRALIALVLVFWFAAAAAVEWALPMAESSPPHAPHALASSLVGEHPVLIDHPHIGEAPSPLPPDTFAEGVLRRVSITLVAVGAIAALAIAALWWQPRAATAVRGPPQRPSTVSSGRAILNRLCIARR